MKRVQDIGIQGKLIGIFAVVFLAGVLALAWNTASLRQTQDDVAREVSTNQDRVAHTLTTSKSEVNQVVATSKEQVNDVFDITDELLFLRVLQLEFREMEGIEKDYVLAADPADTRGLIPAHQEVVGWLQADLATALDSATNDDVRQVMIGLQGELQAQADLFDELTRLVQTDPQAAQQRSLEGSARKADNIYNVLADLVNKNWDAVAASVDETRAQMQAAVDQTTTQMQTAVDQTNAQLTQANDRTHSQLQQAINISLLTIGMFVLAGVVVAAAVFVVSHQIVRPVLEMSDVAEAIENEQFQRAETLDQIAGRQDEIGQLARVFRRMAREVFARMEQLKQQVVQLQIVVDKKKMAQQVAEITDTDYFQDLQAKAKLLRQRGEEGGQVRAESANEVP